jgi:hypothetical protein
MEAYVTSWSSLLVGFYASMAPITNWDAYVWMWNSSSQFWLIKIGLVYTNY